MIDVLGYHRPATYDELWHILDSVEPPVLVCAGCTDLIVKSRAGAIKPATWIELRHLAPLNGLTVERDQVVLGSCLTHHQVATSEWVQKELPALATACAAVGSRQIRSRGTLGGNAANASPCADSMLPLHALNAEVILRSKNGARQISLTEFVVGPGETSIKYAEIIEAFVVPRRLDQRSSFLKIGPRSAVSVAKVSAAASATIDEQGALHDLRLVMGSVAPTQIRMPEAEKLLEGLAPTDDLLLQAGALVEKAVNPIDDVRSSADYRRVTSGVLARRAIKELL